MAATTIKPYPHVQINVKDNSIASVDYVEVLPVHRPLYVMRTQEGPVGVPRWCNTFAEAVAQFGEETFNAANDVYFSMASVFLNDTMTYNGAFIVRYLPEGNAIASYVLFARVTVDENIKQYDYTNGQRTLVFDTDLQEWVEKVKIDETSGEEVTEPGVKIVFGTRSLAPTESLESLAPKKVEVQVTPYETEEAYEFPIFAFRAKYAGAYGNDLAVRLFYSPNSNDAADVQVFKTLFYNIGFGRREYNSTTTNVVEDVYGRENMAFAANPEAVNPDNGASLGIDYVLDKGYSDATHILPVDFFPYESSFKAIGNIIAAYESDESINGYDTLMPLGTLTADEKEAVKAYYFGTPTDEQKAVVEALDFGFKVNSVSCIGLTEIPYDHAYITDTTGVGFTKAELTSSAYFYLGTASGAEGSDGTFIDDKDTANWSSDDRAMYDFCQLNLPVLKDTIVESLHYPFTHLFDLGYSIKTKKAMLKFLDVRDDFIAIMSSQVLKSDGSGRSVAYNMATVNDQAKDEAAVETLRQYALLMRESVLYGTDCMRASIYCHTGILSAGTYGSPVPFTYWSAHQYAMYGNTAIMSAIEPRGLPNAYNELFKEWNWNNYKNDSQNRVWDAGANYVQYADMNRIFYPSLRTVYRASTSVLIDEWFVAAVVYAKYEAKRAWAKFSGRNDPAAKLQEAIQTYLETNLAKLFNGKYTFAVSVYQTAEEQELGYIQHVRMSITSPATMRVLDVDIIVNREGFTPEE